MQVEWRAKDTLRLTNVAPAVTVHPETNRRTWCNHAAVFHITTAASEYRRIAKHTHRALHWLVCSISTSLLVSEQLCQMRYMHDWWIFNCYEYLTVMNSHLFQMALLLWFAIFVKRLFQKENEQGMNAFYGDGSNIPNKDMEAVRNAVWKNTVCYNTKNRKKDNEWDSNIYTSDSARQRTADIHRSFTNGSAVIS